MFRLPRGGKDTRVQEIYFWGGFIFSGMRQVLGKRDDSEQKMFHLFRTRRFQKGEEITVNIPSRNKGWRSDKYARIGRGGGWGRGGDLYVKFTVGKHPVFRRENLNLIMDLDVKISEALLGVEKDIMTLDGLIKLKVPAGINSGEILAVRGKGVPHGHGLSGARGRGRPDDKSRH